MILHDTGSSESFILDSKLNFSSESSTGNSVLIQGIGLEIFSVQNSVGSLNMEKLRLHYDLRYPWI